MRSAAFFRSASRSAGSSSSPGRQVMGSWSFRITLRSLSGNPPWSWPSMPRASPTTDSGNARSFPFSVKRKDLAFPESVVGLARGMLGQLHGGFPDKLRKVILKDQDPITCRPGELLEPADLEAERKKAADRIGGYVDDKALVSWLLYPNVFPDLVRHRDEFSDTSVVPTPVFLYGLEPGQETTIEIEAGKMLIVRLVAVGKLEKDGTRDLYFELNGEARTVTVRDQAAVQVGAQRVKAEKGNASHVGAPMPGKILKVNVKTGDAVKAGTVLVVTEAMKMETNVKAKADCKIAEVKYKEGDKVEKEDLLVVLA